MKQDHQQTHGGNHASHERSYLQFGINMAQGLAVMYAAMFTMIDTGADFRNNLNMLYMAVTMWGPMGIFMLAVMPGMFPARNINVVLYAVLGLLTVGSLWATREQTAIGDRQFIASMVPHHSGAILMCRQAELTDVELAALCNDISQGQRREIEQMNRIAERLNADGH